MPRACPVEPHARSYKGNLIPRCHGLVPWSLTLVATEAPNVRLHGKPVASSKRAAVVCSGQHETPRRKAVASSSGLDRKSTRLNSSHLGISYAVFCLKKKNKSNTYTKSA